MSNYQGSFKRQLNFQSYRRYSKQSNQSFNHSPFYSDEQQPNKKQILQQSIEALNPIDHQTTVYKQQIVFQNFFDWQQQSQKPINLHEKYTKMQNFKSLNNYQQDQQDQQQQGGQYQEQSINDSNEYQQQIILQQTIKTKTIEQQINGVSTRSGRKQRKNNSQQQRQVARLMGLYNQKLLVQKASFQQDNLLKHKEVVFQEFITVLIKNLNPSLINLNHLIQLNQNFQLFKRFLKKNQKLSLLIYGVKSTGKSRSIDWALIAQLKWKKIIVECFQEDSQVSFIIRLNKILQQFFEINQILQMDFNNFEKKSLFATIANYIKASTKKAVLVIQNAHFLSNYKAHKIFYSLGELVQNCNQNFKLIFVTTQIKFLSMLGLREKSRLTLMQLDMLKIGPLIARIFKKRFEVADQQLFSSQSQFLSNYSKQLRDDLLRICKDWFRKIQPLFCHNQSLNERLQSFQKPIETHLNAACWILASLFHFGKVQFQYRKQLESAVVESYVQNMIEMKSLPCRSLLINSNIDQKVLMALVFSMIRNDRRPYNIKTILKLSCEFKAEKVQKSGHIYLNENCLKNAYHKLIRKRIIEFQDQCENERPDRQIKLYLNMYEIKQAIMHESNNQNLPSFVRDML